MDLFDVVEFHIKVVGDRSGESYSGTFSSLRRISHRQEIMRDRYYRELLGPDHDKASERAKSQADLIADLRSCLVKKPTWWVESNEGLDLVDDNVLTEIWQHTVKIRVDAINEIKQRGQEAEDKLKKIVAESK